MFQIFFVSLQPDFCVHMNACESARTRDAKRGRENFKKSRREERRREMTNQNTYNQPAMGEQEQMQQMGIPPHGQMPPQGPMMPQGAMLLQQVPVRRMGRRERWGKMLMAGNALIKQSLPNWFATFAFGTYAVALLGVNLVYSSYATEWYFWLFGIAWVAGFFFLSVKLSQEWSILHIRKQKTFEKKLFWTGFIIRVVYVVFI